MTVQHETIPSGAQTRARSLIHLNNVSKIYGSDETCVRALDQVSLDVYAGEFTAIIGPSGSGKSTLLHCMVGLDSISSGEIHFDGQPLHFLKDGDLTKLRRDQVGFVFQSFNLIPVMTAEENILLPLRLAGRKVDRERLKQIASALQIETRLRHRPSELSGGQQQRVAVARALITQPTILVADEPTGNLDSRSSEEVLGLLRAAVDELGQSLVMVTHDLHAASKADRVLVIRDGKLANDLRQPTVETLSQVI
ncbi:MAG: ABC transporter ATP-binding protein [Eubacteriales bacterium]|nr:ABC transporter ATP-binding protein [Eubacteriales bacterium]